MQLIIAIIVYIIGCLLAKYLLVKNEISDPKASKLWIVSWITCVVVLFCIDD